MASFLKKRTAPSLPRTQGGRTANWLRSSNFQSRTGFLTHAGFVPQKRNARPPRHKAAEQQAGFVPQISKLGTRTRTFLLMQAGFVLKKRNPPTASPGRTIKWLRSSNFQTWDANPDFLAHASWPRSSKTQPAPGRLFPGITKANSKLASFLKFSDLRSSWLSSLQEFCPILAAKLPQNTLGNGSLGPKMAVKR